MSKFADRALLNGKVITMGQGDQVAQALAIANGRIMAVGTNAAISQLVGDETRVDDLAGQAVIPGISDVHTHLELAAIGLELLTDIHTPPCTSIDDILAKLSEACRTKAAGEWVLAQGNIFQETRLRERRYPTGAELDRVSTMHKIAIRLGGHVTILNSAARAAVGLQAGLAQPTQGSFNVDDSGEPTGHTIDMYDTFRIPPFSNARIKAAIAKVSTSHFLKLGVTAIGDVTDSVNGFRATQQLSKSKEMALRVGAYLRVPRTTSFEALIETGLMSGFGDDHMWLAGVKVFADGGMTGRLAATHEPYQSVNGKGKMFWSEAELNTIDRACNDADLQPMIHAAGDRATDIVLDVYETELARQPRRDHRWRIEHIGNPFGTEERLRRIAQLGVVAVPQPPHLYSIGDAFIEVFGAEQAELTMRLRTMIDLGLRPPGSSDLTSSQPESSNPFLGMWSARVRQTYAGKVLNPSESISTLEALRMYTWNGAYALRQEDIRGSIEPGKLADFAVLDRDPLLVTDAELKDTEVVATFVDGRCVYARKSGDFQIETQGQPVA